MASLRSWVRVRLSLGAPGGQGLWVLGAMVSRHCTAPTQFMQKKSPLYVLLKDDTVWSMDHLNRYINDKFRKTKGLPRDWVFTTFTVRVLPHSAWGWGPKVKLPQGLWAQGWGPGQRASELELVCLFPCWWKPAAWVSPYLLLPG